jgi:hypothetical protein
MRTESVPSFTVRRFTEVALVSGGSQAESGDGFPGLRLPQLGIARGVATQDDRSDAAHPSKRVAL